MATVKSFPKGSSPGGSQLRLQHLYDVVCGYLDISTTQIIDKALTTQSIISTLEDPQVALHLLRSCLGVGKINHILHTVPLHYISSQLARFDDHLCLSLSNIAHSPISNMAWQQASLPFALEAWALGRPYHVPM